MKNLFIIIVSLIAIIFVSCHKEEVSPTKKNGILIIDIGLVIREYEVNKGLKATQQTENFKVIVFRADGSEAMVFETASAMPESIEIQPGDYYVEAHSNNNHPAAFDNPYYFGVSEVFTVNSNMQHSVQVICKLANTVVSVLYSDATTSSFTDYSATVSTELGSLVFTKDETRSGYFQPSPIDIVVELTYLNPDGSESSKTLSGKIAEPLPGRHYEIYVNTSLDKGNASFELLMDATEIPVEVIEINDDSGVQDNSGIGYGKLLITEIMFDPAALSDSEGEWFEIYNNSDKTINLQNLVITRDETNKHTILDFIELQPGDYYVLSRTANATDAPNSYVYGTSVLMPNNGAILGIYNEDKDMQAGTLIFSVNYGADYFPSPSGASIILNPDKMNAADAISGTSWCISSSAYNTGDLGTPGKMNDLCL